MMLPEVKRLKEQLKHMEQEILSLKGQIATGQHDYSSTVVPASYSHKHRLSAISNLSKLAGTGIDITGEVLSTADDEIDHDGLYNFVANEHFLQSAIVETGKLTTFGGFGAIDVNFANNTTYRVEADGDAVFKNGYMASLSYYNNSGLLSIFGGSASGQGAELILIGESRGTSPGCAFIRHGGTPGGDINSTFSVQYRANDNSLTTNMTVSKTGVIDAVGGFSDNGTPGVDGTFDDKDGNTITVSGGIITDLGV